VAIKLDTIAEFYKFEVIEQYIRSVPDAVYQTQGRQASSAHADFRLVGTHNTPRFEFNSCHEKIRLS
jgi:hypothetical protein